MSKRDYYEVLNVSRDVDAETLKKVYRKLALQYHPDRNPGDKEDEEKFKEVAEAYSVLSDSDKRARYDQFGHSMGGGAGGFSGFEGFEGFGDVFSDVLEGFFGGGARNRRQSRGRRGADLEYRVEMTLVEALAEKQFDLEIPRKETCEGCGGSGAEKGTKKKTCSDCGGTGEVRISQGFFTMRNTCSRCRGVGEILEKPCGKCRGEGRVKKTRKLQVKIPPGIEHGARLRVAGEGEAGTGEGGRGDLYIQIFIKEHPKFERQGQDLYCKVFIPFTVATLGGEVEIETITGKTKLEIPSGTAAGKILKVKNEGMTIFGTKEHRGDLYVKTDIEVLTKVSKEERDLLEKLAAERGEKIRIKKGFF